MPDSVFIHYPEYLNTLGHNAEFLLAGDKAIPQSVAFDKTRSAYFITPPPLPRGIFDRKIQRNIESQTHRLLFCVAGLAPRLRDLNTEPSQLGLTAAIPEVDEPSPCWDAVSAIAQQPDQLLSGLVKNTPPLHALKLLNTSAMAYAAEACNCHGPMAGFCSHDNSGSDAIVEAYEQVATEKSKSTLVISTSPNITPAIYLRNPSDNSIKGEGSAALIVSSQYVPGSIELISYSRAFNRQSDNTEFLSSLIKSVIKKANIEYKYINIVINNSEISTSEFLPNANQHSPTASMVGDLGPSNPLTDIALLFQLFNRAHQRDALQFGMILNSNDSGHCSAFLFATRKMKVNQ